MLTCLKTATPSSPVATSVPTALPSLSLRETAAPATGFELLSITVMVTVPMSLGFSASVGGRVVSSRLPQPVVIAVTPRASTPAIKSLIVLFVVIGVVSALPKLKAGSS
ncbi:hypothetical protein D3C72_732110 [compost metagenome]